MNFHVAMAAAAALLTATPALAAPPAIDIPATVQLPQLEPIITPCADPAADRFLEIDISQRAPAGATKVQKISGWVTDDGIFHWPFVMRVRNAGDKPFMGKKGKQSVVVIEDDLISGKKGRVVASVPFDRIDARSGVAARFLFEAPAEAMNKRRFHRIYTLKLKYDDMGTALVDGPYGDCNLRNNEWFVEFDGSRPKWIYAK